MPLHPDSSVGRTAPAADPAPGGRGEGSVPSGQARVVSGAEPPDEEASAARPVGERVEAEGGRRE
jgi:hypothetical protein